MATHREPSDAAFSALADEQADHHKERMARLVDNELYRANEPLMRRLDTPRRSPRELGYWVVIAGMAPIGVGGWVLS